METNAQVEYKVVTSVESIVPNGFGRSRIISANEEKDYALTLLYQIQKLEESINLVPTQPERRNHLQLLNF